MISSIHNAIVNKLTTHFGSRVETITVYSDNINKIKTPAILIELSDIGTADDDGTGRDPQQLSFQLHCVLSRQTPDIDINIRAFASELLQLIRQQNFGVESCHLTENIDAMPGDFKPTKDGFESWIVSFELPTYIGEGDFNTNEVPIIPTEVAFFD